MTESNSDHFEMRRLESLSNTIFGVAMTLLAYDLPKAGFERLPSWTDLYHLYAARLSGLVLSFIIAGIFWFGHHRRLARQPYGSRNVVFLNLLFLLSIIFVARDQRPLWPLWSEQRSRRALRPALDGDRRAQCRTLVAG